MEDMHVVWFYKGWKIWEELCFVTLFKASPVSTCSDSPGIPRY